MSKSEIINGGWNGTSFRAGDTVRCWDKESGFKRGPQVRVVEISGNRATVEVLGKTGCWNAGDRVTVSAWWLEGGK